jgi:hypothetical protein
VLNEAHVALEPSVLERPRNRRPEAGLGRLAHHRQPEARVELSDRPQDLRAADGMPKPVPGYVRDEKSAQRPKREDPMAWTMRQR